MNLEHTRMVTPENGPRPAEKPTECFYCQQTDWGKHSCNRCGASK